MEQAILLGFSIVVSSTLVILGVLMIYNGLFSTPRRTQVAIPSGEADAVFIFRDEDLVDCSDRARQILDLVATPLAEGRKARPLDKLIAFLLPRFPTIVQDLKELAKNGSIELTTQGPEKLALHARFRNGMTHIRLSEPEMEGKLLAIDRLSYDAMQSELQLLREVMGNTAVLVWKLSAEADVVWANAAYIAHLQDSGVRSRDLRWPLPNLFDDTAAPQDARLSLDLPQKTCWFSHHEVAMPDGSALHFATPIDASVRSEAARRETLQTLTRIFASLPIGLALFDADRKLQVFNPALVYLTGLDPLFLATRPSFEQVLFTLRELRMLPEPKDFHNWRREIIEMEKAAETGEYSEEWCLDTGRTYHISGRPQPNGALALFIDDVTSETTMTRSFRAEIETAQNVLDSVAEGVVAFSLSGQTVLSNSGYRAMWGSDPCTDAADQGLSQALALWASRCEATTMWARLAEFAANPGKDTRITGTTALKTGVPLTITAQRLVGGGVTVLFRRIEHHGTLERARDIAQSEPFKQVDRSLPPQSMSVDDIRSTAPLALPKTPRRPRSARHVGSRVRVS